MTRQEAIETIKIAISQVEWEYPMDYAAAFDMAVEALNQPEIVRCKECVHSCDYTNILSGRAYKCINNGSYHNGGWYCADGERR